MIIDIFFSIKYFSLKQKVQNGEVKHKAKDDNNILYIIVEI